MAKRTKKPKTGKPVQQATAQIEAEPMADTAVTAHSFLLNISKSQMRTAWAIVGALIAQGAIDVPDSRDPLWLGALSAYVITVADTLSYQGC